MEEKELLAPQGQEVEEKKEEKQKEKKIKPVKETGAAEITPTTDASSLYIPAQIFEKALENPEVLTHIMNVRREIRDEIARKKFYEALSQAQSEIGPIEKNAVVYNRDSKTIRYRYATLDVLLKAISPIFKYGFSIRHESELLENGGHYRITTYLTHKDGWSEKAVFTAKIGVMVNMSQVQEIGAIESYGRRYNILKLLNLAGDEDTDANLNSTIDERGNVVVEQKNNNSQTQPTQSKTGYSEMIRVCFGILQREFGGDKNQLQDLWHEYLKDTFGIASSKQIPPEVSYSEVIKMLNNWVKMKKEKETATQSEQSEEELPF